MKIFNLLFIAFSIYVLEVVSHGRLTEPPSRGIFAGKQPYQELAPVVKPLNSEFICRNDPAVPASSYITLTAGAAINLRWDFSAAHVGDCFAYLTYDADKPENEMKWFKIAEYADCRSKLNQDIPLNIPNYLPSCTHCILRWEWYALHVRPNIEFYSQCVDVVITGSPSGVIPGPRFNIPGHLPEDGTLYRDGYGTTFYFTGPPVAYADWVDPEGDDRIPCVKNEDCASKLCQVNNFCYKVKGLGAGGIAAVILALLFAAIVGVGVAFFYLNKSEIPYLKPFKR